MKRKQILVVALIVLASFVLSACGPGSTPAPSGNEDAIKDIVVALNSDIKSLDPHKSNDGPSILIWNQMYNTLVNMDYENRELLPGLAEDWEHLDDKTIRFTIRQGVKFHDGTELTAEDVAFSIGRLIDPATKSPAAYLLNMIDEITVEDEYHVTFGLSEPFAPIMFHFTHPASSILPKAAVEAAGEDEFAKAPVGTGPFVFESYAKGDEVRLVANAEYWEGAPVPETVTVRIIPEPSTQVAELESGGIHIAYNIPTQEVDRLKENPELDVLAVMGWSVQGLVFNYEREPFDDVRVRQAFNYALDKDAIVKHVESGLAEPSGQALAPTVFGYNPDIEPYGYDIEKAKELLADAGFPDGLSTKILVWNMERYVLFAEAVQAQLANAGIDAKLDIIEFGAALDMAYVGDFDITLMQWGTTTLDGDYTYYSLMHSDNWGAAGNWGHYKNDEVDELVMEARVNPDQDVRLESYQKAGELIKEDAPWLFSHFPMVAYGVRANLKDCPIPISYINTDFTKAHLEAN